MQKLFKTPVVVGLVSLMGLAACGEPKAFSAAMEPVALADGSRQQTAVGQVQNGECGKTATQLVTYHQPRHSHTMKPVAAGTVVTDNGCAAVLGALAAVAGAALIADAGGSTVSAVANSASSAVSNASVKTGGSKY